MKKKTALALFDDNAAAVALHVGMTRHAVYKWPQKLPRRAKLLVLGARVVLNARIKQGTGEPLSALELDVLAED